MSKSFSWQHAISALVLVATALMQGCAQLPPLPQRVASHALTGDEVAATRLAQLTRRPAGVPADRDSGVRGLPNPLEAFGTRVVLARTAERSLDVQYYIWHDDTTGNLLLEELFDAADRGVRVRLLIDDNGLGMPDGVLAALSGHPNAQVRLFNPFASRGGGKMLGYLNDFGRLNHRMHNKSFTADASATVVGGRNIGDEYFGADEDLLFADLDALAVGKAARDVSGAFDLYWNCDQAYPVQVIVGPPAPDAWAQAKAKFAAVRATEAASHYSEAVVTSVHQSLTGDRLALDWVETKLVYDDPVKATGTASPSDLLFNRLLEAAGGARESLDLVSPYFVPGQDGATSLARAARSGIAVRVVTNSLASSDGVAVHSGYARYREELLRGGVRIFELKPSAEQDSGVKQGLGSRFRGSSGSTLHAKTFEIDHDRVFVGSFNLDQRSLFLNTEMGLVIRSPKLARALSETLDRELPRIAFEVRLKEDGSGLQWLEQTGSGTVRYDTEPQASLGRRMGAAFLSLLPIEWLL